MKTQYAMPEHLTGSELKEYRLRLGLTQKALADFAAVSKKTVERWESSDSPIRGPIVPLLRILADKPGMLSRYEIPPASKGVRLWYMYRSVPCTLIDVNDREKTVSIHNFTSDNQFRAFGANESPTYQDYDSFLKSRCFPESRDIA